VRGIENSYSFAVEASILLRYGANHPVIQWKNGHLKIILLGIWMEYGFLYVTST